MKNLYKKYFKLYKIGEGVYGIVRKAQNRETREFVAIKRIRINDEDDGVPYTVINEIAALKELKGHKNIVSLIEYTWESDKIYLVFEFMNYDLREYIDVIRCDMDPRLIKSYMYQLLLGVHHCHKHRIIHCDLKPRNLLIDNKGLLKIADFGLSKFADVKPRDYSSCVQTIWYRAPEVLLGMTKYSMNIDMWSIGCIFVEMVTRETLLPGDSHSDQLNRIFRIFGTPNEESWPGVSELPEFKSDFPIYKPKDLSELFPKLEPSGIDLITKMLQMDPSKRITISEALDHPYFDEFKNNKWFDQNKKI